MAMFPMVFCTPEIYDCHWHQESEGSYRSLRKLPTRSYVEGPISGNTYKEIPTWKYLHRNTYMDDYDSKNTNGSH